MWDSLCGFRLCGLETYTSGGSREKVGEISLENEYKITDTKLGMNVYSEWKRKSQKITNFKKLACHKHHKIQENNVIFSLIHILIDLFFL